ncbi:MAG: hypothetical protein IKI20_06015 [Lachnospiraceae bacterium]|nr:hypothetical protein [Lachnospiraceae bacterium]
MRFRNDETFDRTPIQELDEISRQVMHRNVLESTKNTLISSLTNIGKKADRRSANGKIGKLGYLAIFGITGSILGILIAILSSKFDITIQGISLLPIIFSFVFIFWGVAMLICVSTGFGFQFRSFKGKVTGECIGYQYWLDNGLLVCAPVYTYTFLNDQYTAFDEAALNSVSVHETIGSRKELFLDTDDPDYFSTKVSKNTNYLLIVVALVLIAAGLFVGYATYQSQITRKAGRQSIQIETKDNKIVLTEELLQADRQANIVYNIAILNVLKYGFWILAIVAVTFLIRSIRSYRISKERGWDEDARVRRLFILISAFSVVFLCGIGYITSYSVKSEKEKSGTPLTIQEYIVTGKHYTKNYDSANETTNYSYYLEIQDGEDLKVGNDVYESVKLSGLYYMSVGTSGGIVKAYYSDEYTLP